MKYWLFVLILVPVLSKAQDCSIKTAKDPYTREMKASSGFIILNNAKYSVEASKTQIDFMFSLEGKCFDGSSAAAVFFDSTKVKTNFKNGGTMNCEGLFHFNFRNTTPVASALSNLATKKVASIRFKDNTGKETGVIFTVEQQQMFKALTNCIIEEAKKLQ